MASKYIIALDIGTSGCKCILIDHCGSVVATDFRSYPCDFPRPGWVEQNPNDWWSAAVQGLAAVLAQSAVAPAEIAAVGLSAQMHGLVALDAKQQPVRPAILWNDQRTGAQCQQIYQLVGGRERLLDYTNNQMLPGYTGGKILWLRQQEPENYHRAKHFLNPKDYIRLRLSRTIATDASDASGTGLFDVKNRVWSSALLAKLDIDPATLPSVCESTEIAGRVAPAAAAQTGLLAGTPISAGGGDSVVQTSGTGVVDESRLMTTIGTAGVLATGLSQFSRNVAGNLQVFCHNTPGAWHVMGVTLSAGASYQWLNKLYRGHTDRAQQDSRKLFAQMDAQAAESPPGSRKLLFLPYLNGERCPHTDPAARGVFFGLSLQHGAGELARAVMEGVIYSLYDVYQQVQLLVDSQNIAEIRTSGGGAASPLWRQIHADVFQLPVVTVSGASEGGAYGAALLAGIAAGLWGSLPQAIGVLEQSSCTEPNPRNRAVYEDLFGLYRRLYPALQAEFHRLEAI